MAEYIDRKAAIEAVRHSFYSMVGAVILEKAIEAVPSADVVPVAHARWVNYSPVTIKCSRCGHVIHDWRYSECKYCPNCGAKMDGKGEE